MSERFKCRISHRAPLGEPGRFRSFEAGEEYPADIIPGGPSKSLWTPVIAPPAQPRRKAKEVKTDDN